MRVGQVWTTTLWELLVMVQPKFTLVIIESLESQDNQISRPLCTILHIMYLQVSISNYSHPHCITLNSMTTPSHALAPRCLSPECIALHSEMAHSRVPTPIHFVLRMHDLEPQDWPSRGTFVQLPKPTSFSLLACSCDASARASPLILYHA